MTQETTSKPPSSSSSSSSALEITAETSARVCRHMNDDHPATVYGMAKRCLERSSPLPNNNNGGWKLTSATMTKVTLDGCELQATACSGDLCEIKALSYPFVPPLQGAGQVKARMVAIHHQVLSPQWHWLYTQPLALKILLAFLALAHGTLVMGGDGLTAFLDATHLIKAFYPKTYLITMLVQVAFYVTVVAHTYEASWAAFICKKTLKLNWKGTVQWTVMVFLVGFPILGKLQSLQKRAQQKDKEKHDKTS